VSQKPEKSNMTDFVAHLTRQAAFSRATFGPGPRTKGVTDHIKKELKEVEKCYHADPKPKTYDDQPELAMHMAAAAEWTDVAVLGLDGLTRAISAARPNWTFDRVAAEAVRLIVSKQGKNELRDWPDWRGADPEKAIEHVRGKHD
jgi:hypothetical protein